MAPQVPDPLSFPTVLMSNRDYDQPGPVLLVPSFCRGFGGPRAWWGAEGSLPGAPVREVTRVKTLGQDSSQ